MAQKDKLISFILSWEGGFSDHPNDRGKATNMGVTMATFERYCKRKGYPAPTVERLRNLTMDQWMDIFDTLYWDVCRADEIVSQPIANLIMDWYWCSGTWAIKYTQQILGVKADGVVGPITLAALNSASPLPLFGQLWKRRERHFLKLSQQPGQNVFLVGWLRRLHSITFEDLYNNE